MDTREKASFPDTGGTEIRNPESGGVAARTHAFMDSFGLRIPILMAPMAGANPPALAAAVARAGGMGALGAVYNEP